MPSFQRNRVGRLTGMRRANSASPMPVRSMQEVNSSAKVGNRYNFGTLKSLNETLLQLGVYTIPWESEAVCWRRCPMKDKQDKSSLVKRNQP